MPICDICGQDVSHLPQHRHELHSEPPAMLIAGEMREVRRSGADNALECPAPGCSHRYPRVSKFRRHVKIDHNHPTGKKRTLSSSMESLSDGVHKKTKLAFQKASDVLKSMAR